VFLSKKRTFALTKRINPWQSYSRILRCRLPPEWGFLPFASNVFSRVASCTFFALLLPAFASLPCCSAMSLVGCMWVVLTQGESAALHKRPRMWRRNHTRHPAVTLPMDTRIPIGQENRTGIIVRTKHPKLARNLITIMPPWNMITNAAVSARTFSPSAMGL